MKLIKIWYIIFVISLLFGCQNEQKFDGNYSMCNNGEYAEVYFKKDSMRMASENEWVKLSEWRKMKIKNDTLFFQSFGEWREDWKAEINYKGNKAELNNLTTGIKLDLKRIDEDVNFENVTDFWGGFNKRKEKRNCE